MLTDVSPDVTKEVLKCTAGILHGVDAKRAKLGSDVLEVTGDVVGYELTNGYCGLDLVKQ